MLINSHETPSNSIVETSICVIGSGLGGGSFAIAAAKTGADIVVIEAGGLTPISPGQFSVNSGRSFDLRSTRSIQLGGTSNLWHGVLAPLDPIDFEFRDWIPNSGWPIDYSTLEPFYREASGLFGVSNKDYFDEDSLSESLKEKLGEMSFNRSLLRNKLFQQPLPPKNLKQELVKIARTSRNVDVYYNARALELIPNSTGSAVESVLVGIVGSKTFLVSAKHFVLSAGALETPRLLLNSRKFEKNGLGNANNLVGRYLMDHPMGNLAQVEFHRQKKAHIYADMKYSQSCKIKSGIVLTDSTQKQEKLPNHNFYFRPSFVKGIDNQSEKIKLSLLTFKDGGLKKSDIWRLLNNYNVVLQILAYKFALNLNYKYADLFFVTEQIPSSDSYVGLSDEVDQYGYKKADVNWRISTQDKASMISMFRLLKERALKGIDLDFVHSLDDLNWDGVYTSAAHHVGTARMAATERIGVVDPNLKLFSTENLYVCDGSVFTTSGNVNSGLTIAALALRLCKHIRGQI